MATHSKLVRGLFAFTVTCSMVLSGCAGEADGPVVAPPSDTNPDNGDDGEDPGTNPAPDEDPQELAACPGAKDFYLLSIGAEARYFGGPNISVLLSDGDVAVIFPADPNYKQGTFDLAAGDVWATEFCVNWDEDSSSCETNLEPLSGKIVIDELIENDGDGSQVRGKLQDAVFVDDAQNPTCQVKVDTTFEADIL